MGVVAHPARAWGTTVAAGLLVGAAQDVIPSVTALPAAVVVVPPVVGIEPLPTVRIAAVVVAITQRDLGAADLANSPMDAVAALPAGIVVKADNECVDLQVSGLEERRGYKHPARTYQ